MFCDTRTSSTDAEVKIETFLVSFTLSDKKVLKKYMFSAWYNLHSNCVMSTPSQKSLTVPGQCSPTSRLTPPSTVRDTDDEYTSSLIIEMKMISTAPGLHTVIMFNDYRSCICYYSVCALHCKINKLWYD